MTWILARNYNHKITSFVLKTFKIYENTNTILSVEPHVVLRVSFPVPSIGVDGG